MFETYRLRAQCDLKALILPPQEVLGQRNGQDRSELLKLNIPTKYVPDFLFAFATIRNN